MKRREFLRGVAGAAGAALTGGALAEARRALPDPSASGIEHVVVLMMENRSFDHLLGWLPNSDGRQSGLWYRDRGGVPRQTFPLAPDFTGCGRSDPDHSYLGGRIQFAGGTMSGFLRDSPDDFPIGFYTEADRPFFNALARRYTTLDRSFCSILGPTFPNRMFLHAAQTDRLDDSFTLATMPTVWDRLEREGISHRYYYANLPFLALWGAKYAPISHFYVQFLIDAAFGQLPAVSFVDPVYTLLDDGTGTDDHPHADIRRGDAFVSQIFHAVASGPKWSSTVFIVTYDEWGGFFDHVPPPRAAAANALDPDVVGGRARLGFRVPTIVASPWSRGHWFVPRVDHSVFDHTSILKLIEWRWGLTPLTPRDASNDVGNLASVLDFEHPRVDVPPLPRPAFPPAASCGSAPALSTAASKENEWLGLLASPRLGGWPIGTPR